LKKGQNPLIQRPLQRWNDCGSKDPNFGRAPTKFVRERPNFGSPQTKFGRTQAHLGCRLPRFGRGQTHFGRARPKCVCALTKRVGRPTKFVPAGPSPPGASVEWRVCQAATKTN